MGTRQPAGGRGSPGQFRTGSQCSLAMKSDILSVIISVMRFRRQRSSQRHRKGEGVGGKKEETGRATGLQTVGWGGSMDK